MVASRFVSGLRAVTLPAGHGLVRVHALNRGPVFFGPAPGSRPQNRFDAPDQEYRVLYAAEHLEGAFVETALRRANSTRNASRRLSTTRTGSMR